ncbi:hypothetical protein LIER_05186 [Lithospermum erythrorhizon]|uniref:Uncharacterized protein n=1 Tax=Lithospermum erythrorhizon TaxID=34254 RepID=A0AAV3NZK8_LITER
MGPREGTCHYPGPRRRRFSAQEEECWPGQSALGVEEALRLGYHNGTSNQQVLLGKFATKSVKVGSYRLGLGGRRDDVGALDAKGGPEEAFRTRFLLKTPERKRSKGREMIGCRYCNPVFQDETW